MIWIVILLVAALILSLGCNVKQEFQIEQLEIELDKQIEATLMLRSRTETYGTARPYTQLYDDRLNAITDAAKWGNLFQEAP